MCCETLCEAIQDFIARNQTLVVVLKPKNNNMTNVMHVIQIKCLLKEQSFYAGGLGIFGVVYMNSITSEISINGFILVINLLLFRKTLSTPCLCQANH